MDLYIFTNIYIYINTYIYLLYQCLLWTFPRWYFFFGLIELVSLSSCSSQTRCIFLLLFFKPGWYPLPSQALGTICLMRRNCKKLGESMKSWWQNVFRNYWPPIIRRSLRCCILRWQLQDRSSCHLYQVDLDLLVEFKPEKCDVGNNVETLGTKGSTVFCT